MLEGRDAIDEIDANIGQRDGDSVVMNKAIWPFSGKPRLGLFQHVFSDVEAADPGGRVGAAAKFAVQPLHDETGAGADFEAHRLPRQAEIGEMPEYRLDVVVRPRGQPVRRHAIMNPGVDAVQTLIRIVPGRGGGMKRIVSGGLCHDTLPFSRRLRCCNARKIAWSRSLYSPRRSISSTMSMNAAPEINSSRPLGLE